MMSRVRHSAVHVALFGTLCFGVDTTASPPPTPKNPPVINEGIQPAGPIVAGELRLDDATKVRGGVASGGSSEATVFDQPNDSGFGWFMKQDDVFGYSTWASQAIFANGFAPGHSVSSYEMTFFHSSSDDETYGDATVTTELWDGDPMSVMETICTVAGVSAPIPGTQATFSGLPYGTVVRLRAELPTKATVDCDRVWIAMTMVEGCRGAWRIAGRDGGSWNAPPTVGTGNGVWLLWACEQFGSCDTETGYNAGTCCAFGPGDPNEVCDHANFNAAGDDVADRCATTAAAGISFCGDGEADYFVAFINEPGIFRGLVSTVSAATGTTVQIVPVSVDAPPAEGGSAAGVISLSGNDLVLQDGDHNVWLEMRIGDWDPDDAGVILQAWSVQLEGSSLQSGDQGELTAYTAGGAGTCLDGTGEPDHAICEALLGPGSRCDPVGNLYTILFGPGHCSYLFADLDRPDFVYHPDYGAKGPIIAFGLSKFDVRTIANVITHGADDPEPFPDGGLYASTLTLHVPSNAKGAFTVELKPFPNSQLVDQFFEFIPLLGTIPATITVQTGACCFDIDLPDGGTCLDTLMTAGACSQMPGVTEFHPNGSCGVEGACPGPLGRCCFPDRCVDGVREEECHPPIGLPGNFTPDASCSDEGSCSEFWGRCCFNRDSPGGPKCNATVNFEECFALPGFASFEFGSLCGVVNPCFDCITDSNAATALELEKPATPEPESHAQSAKSRYLSLMPGNPGVETALEVTLIESDQFPAAPGMAWWVGAPSEFCENGGETNPPCPPVAGVPSSTFLSSTLQCTPHCMDFGSLGEVLHIGDPNVVPDARYEVRAIACKDGAINHSSCSVGLPIATSRQGDVVSSCETCPCEPSEGSVDILDCKVVVDRFISAPCAPIKTRVDLEPGNPDRRINITDVLQCILVGIQGGVDYDLSEPQRCK